MPVDACQPASGRAELPKSEGHTPAYGMTSFLHRSGSLWCEFELGFEDGDALAPDCLLPWLAVQDSCTLHGGIAVPMELEVLAFQPPVQPPAGCQCLWNRAIDIYLGWNEASSVSSLVHP